MILQLKCSYNSSWEYHSGAMGSAAALPLTLQRVQVFGSSRLVCTRQLSPGLRGVPALIRSSNHQQEFRHCKPTLGQRLQVFQHQHRSGLPFTTSGFIVTRASTKPSFGSPCAADLHLGARRFARCSASAVPPDSQSVASTSASSEVPRGY